MNRTKRRQEQFVDERLSQLKPRKKKHKNNHSIVNSKTRRKTQDIEPDSSEHNNVTATHAQRIREYRKRQRQMISKKED